MIKALANCDLSDRRNGLRKMTGEKYGSVKSQPRGTKNGHGYAFFHKPIPA